MRNSSGFSFLGNSLSTLLAVALASSSEASGAPAWIIDGLPTDENEFPEVVSVYYPSEHISGRVELCTGTLIHPHVILTSAHCVPANPATHVTVNQGTSVRAPTRQPRAVFSIRHESYVSAQAETLATDFDFGIVVLQDAIADVIPARLVSMEDTTIRRALLAKKALEVVGFGGSRRIGTDMTTGTQRRATTRAVQTLDQQFSTEGPVSALSIGDSGGPAFLFAANRPRHRPRHVVGVASGVPADKLYSHEGRPPVSYYAGIRSEIVEWISERSGYPIDIATLGDTLP